MVIDSWNPFIYELVKLSNSLEFYSISRSSIKKLDLEKNYFDIDFVQTEVIESNKKQNYSSINWKGENIRMLEQKILDSFHIQQQKDMNNFMKNFISNQIAEDKKTKCE